MKTLVLNVDRDDDFGRKANVKSPIVGYEKNLEAANKLGQADPEDSDLNAIYYAISTYLKLKKEKKKVEIATICGHIKVGLKSDEILSNQLEDVIKETNVDSVILISDGAEDEHILPIIQSRIKILSVCRVAVKQSKEIEATYYRLLKILDDEKVLKQFVLPISLVLIVWAFFVLLDMTASGFGAILLTLGAYLLIRVFRWEKNIAYMWEDIKSGFLTGKLSIYTYILAIVILVASGFLAYQNTDFKSDVGLIPILSFVKNMIWGIVLSGLVALFGRIVDTYVKDRKILWTYWVMPFSLFAFGFISYAVFDTLEKSLEGWPSEFIVEYFFSVNFIFYTIAGIMIALIGAITHHYIKEMHSTDEKEREVESQTKKLAEEN